MQRLAVLADRIDRMNAAVGRAAAWCVLFMVLVQFLVVLLRYRVRHRLDLAARNRSFMPMRCCFCCAAAWTLAAGRACARRYFLFRGIAAARGPGSIFAALAFFCCRSCCAIFVLSLPYVARSWVDAGAVARGERAAAGFRAQDADSAFRGAARAARFCAGDPRVLATSLTGPATAAIPQPNDDAVMRCRKFSRSSWSSRSAPR